jgi:hypothetical protein
MVTTCSCTVNILREDFARELLWAPILFRENALTLPIARQQIKRKEVMVGHALRVSETF